MINTQYVKTKLIRALGEKQAAFIQALRFVYLLHTRRNLDPEIALLPALLQKGEGAVDVGANGANWTYWLHRSVGRNGFVFAFEADPYYALATDLTIRLLRLKGVRLFAFGLSDSDEEVPLRINDSDGLRLAGLSHIDRSASKAADDVKVVNLKRLDSLTKDYPQLLSTRLIKCDVEGFELYVFRGAAQILERSRPFVILETGNFAVQGYSSRDLHDFFVRRDYEAYALTGENRLERTNAELEHKKALTVNRVLLPKERVAKMKQNIRFLE